MTEHFSALLGHSVNNPALEALLVELGFKERPSLHYGLLYEKEITVALDFTSRYGYLHNYGEPKSFYTDDFKNEMFLINVTFNNDYADTQKPFPFPLPFGLLLGDDFDTVCKKLGSKPVEKSITDYGSACYFIKDDYRALTGFNSDKKLLWLSLWLTSLQYKKAIALKKALKGQDKHINATNAVAVQKLVDAMPTAAWKSRMTEGDTIFTERNINATEVVMQELINQLVAATVAGKASKVYAAAKKAVIAINRLNDKHGHIDTLEREELVAFIHKAVRETGFMVEDGLDITEEWREW